jgi:hypothetical protein
MCVRQHALRTKLAQGYVRARRVMRGRAVTAWRRNVLLMQNPKLLLWYAPDTCRTRWPQWPRERIFGERTTSLPACCQHHSEDGGRGEASHVRARLQVFKRKAGLKT